MYSRRLSILLVTSEVTQKEKITGIGLSESFLDDSEFVDYVELLAASNFNFDIIEPNKISFETFFIDNVVRYSTVIFATPLSSLSDSTLSTLKEVSYRLGISLISSYTNLDQRSKPFFGIQTVRGKRHLWPLKVKIIRWPRGIYKGEIVASYGLISGLSGVRKRGLGRLVLRQTLAKLIKLFNNLFLLYIKVDLEPGTNVLSTDMKGNPIAWSYQFGKGTNYYFGLHGDLFLDKFNEMHRLVRAAIEANSGYGMVSVDLENTIVLRLDDPGACSTDYLNNRKILEEGDWEKIGRILEDKRIPLSVMYTPGWVDDGDTECGTLVVDGKEKIEREAGVVYDSAQVKYTPLISKNGVYDHSSEFRGLKKLVEKGFADVHSHGLTHLDPDYKRWSKAEDRNKDTQWYHEFYHVKDGRPVKNEEQIEAMSASGDKILNLFGVSPLAFTPSGHRHDAECDLLARDAGYLIFSADYTGILKKNILIRNWKIPSLFFYLKDPTLFAYKSGYPFIGVVHDYEIKKGFEKFEDIIQQWCNNGVKRFISMRDLIASLCTSIDVYYHAAESLMKVVISLPQTRTERLVSELVGAELHLRVILPERTVRIENLLSVSGANLLSVERLRDNDILEIAVKLTGDPNFAINVPMCWVE